MNAVITWLQGKKTNILSWCALILGALVLSGALTPAQEGEANQRLATTFQALVALLVELAGLFGLTMRAAIAKNQAASEEVARLIRDDEADILPYNQRP